ncbi:serine hydrolase domain-containing protein [Aurantiacibacter sp. MUD61]|uniref:serine hydrolase domain-containing protein n=1 Tax=Aurantiacibacter sp. MUD61 TaxID=3009083 RepID=UPI0022F05D32|nr:serine hydrolase domain-containing protein [Aurantiacibacter sp. MUD61]
MLKFIAPLALLATTACSHVEDSAAITSSAEPPAHVDALARELVVQENIGGIGLARIEGGEVIWTGYYGEERAGEPVGPETAFNVASVAKVLIAETVLRLVDRGAMSLDDPIHEFYRHPDLADDPRYSQLTPRLILSHQAGLLNWPYSYEDGRLAFIDEPGNGEVHYSGAAIQMLARYLEARFEAPYPEIVDRELLDPLGITGIAPTREAWLEGRVSDPVDGEGRTWVPFTNDPSGAMIEVGAVNAADNAYATVPAFAQFLVAMLDGGGLSAELQLERQRFLSSSDSELGYVCVAEADACPEPLGYALGWGLFGEPGRTVLNHGGNDFAEHAQVWFIPETDEGFVMFVNGGSAFADGLRIVEAVDPDLRMAKHYRALFDMMAAQQGE